MRDGVFHRRHHLRFRFAHADPADRVAVPAHFDQGPCGLFPQVGIGRALHNAEKERALPRVIASGPPIDRTLLPAQREVEAPRRLLMRARMRRALVESHDDIRTERVLDFHRGLGADETRTAIEMVLEMGPLLRDTAQLRQGKNLETTAVGQNRTIPAHELVQAADLADDVEPRTHEKMVGIAEDDLRMELPQFARTHRLHRSLRADRHENRCTNNSATRVQHSAACGRRRVSCRDFEPNAQLAPATSREWRDRLSRQLPRCRMTQSSRAFSKPISYPTFSLSIHL